MVDAWGAVMQAGNGKALSADFKALFEKACAYRTAKEVADNHRDNDRLTEEDATREQTTKKEFLDAYIPVASMAMEWCARRV